MLIKEFAAKQKLYTNIGTDTNKINSVRPYLLTIRAKKRIGVAKYEDSAFF